MATIDKFIEAIFQYKADGLVAKSGDRVSLVTGGAPKPVTPEPASAQQIDTLLREIVPADRVAEVAADGDHEFAYESPAGSVIVKVSRSGGALQMQIAPGALAAAAVAEGSAPISVAAAPAEPIAVEHAPDPTASASSTESPPPSVSPAPAPPAPVASSSPAVTTATSGSTEAIDALFHKLVAEGCSDLHLSSGQPPQFRKDGEMVTLGDETPVSKEQVREILMPIAPAVNVTQFEEEHDTDFAYEIKGLARFRCNFFLDLNGMGGVFRVIPSKIPSAQDLGLSAAILDLCNLHKGLVVVTGPTGSGKSTTLAAMIDHINETRGSHIITIEDPVEFVHPKKKCLINQREVGPHTESFKRALRAALREDPDIVLVGEMRDLETVAIAIETAETGHLVFGTLHTTTAPSTVDRIIDQFATDRQAQVRTMLSESLRGVISQTLCKKIGGGRVAAQEILLINSAMSNLIREGKTFQIPSLMQTGKGQGMITLNDALLELVKNKVVEPAEAYAKSVNRTEFKSLLGRAGVQVEGMK